MSTIQTTQQTPLHWRWTCCPLHAHIQTWIITNTTDSTTAILTLLRKPRTSTSRSTSPPCQHAKTIISQLRQLVEAYLNRLFDILTHPSIQFFHLSHISRHILQYAYSDALEDAASDEGYHDNEPPIDRARGDHVYRNSVLILLAKKALDGAPVPPIERNVMEGEEARVRIGRLLLVVAEEYMWCHMEFGDHAIRFGLLVLGRCVVRELGREGEMGLLVDVVEGWEGGRVI